MIYEKMIETENSDPMRAAWAEYRKALTEYIREGIESYYRRAHLAKQGKLRDQAFGLKADAPLEEKPVVAVWGAGRCNDLDLQMLAPYVRFVLIDRDAEAMERARTRFGFSGQQCICVNPGFWEIYEEEERFFENLLAEADDLHVSEYLRQVMDSVVKQEPELEEFAQAFDFSVVCGLASQLNARFAGLLQLYGKDLRELPRTAAILQEMNVKAAGRLMDAVSGSTKRAVFTANEMYAATPMREERLTGYAQIWTEEWEQILNTRAAEPAMSMDVEGITCQVAGSREFELQLEHAQKNGLLELRHRSGLVWPFSDEKYFFMDVLTAYFINNEIK